MPRPPTPPEKRKVPVTTRLDPDLYDWIAARVGPGKRFATVTHALEMGIAVLREEEGSAGRGARSVTSKK